MQAAADRVVLSSGWTRRLIALIAGAFGAMALAPLNFGPALIVTMVTAVWLVDGASRRSIKQARLDWRALRSAFGSGWWLGFGYFVAGFWWLGAAFIIDPEFTYLLPAGVLGFPALLAVFPAFGFVAARLLWVPGARRILALALGLGLSEWARGHLFTGFPWNAFGMGLGGNLVTAQAASLVGLDGLTFLTVALCAAPATLLDRHTGRRRFAPALMAVVVAAAIVGYGALRLNAAKPSFVPDALVRIMQPGIRPDINFSPENRHEIVSHYIDLSKEDDTAKGIKLADVTMLVWPESAFPFILTQDPEELERIGASLPANTTLVTGAAREDDRPATSAEPPHREFYNAIDVIAPGGIIIDSYDKVHLVPFGEYLPFHALLSRLGLRNFVPVPGGFEPGHIRRSLSVPRMPPAAPLICYEAIFPGEALFPGQVTVRGSTISRPRYLLNITNDGWFGVTSGPSQHFAQARLRSIEEGLPMVRGAATGISAMLDPYGRVLASIPLGAEGILDSRLPEPINPPPFAVFGGWPLTMLWISAVLTITVF